MDTLSDIVGLFAKLPYEAVKYQEISSAQEAVSASSRWALVDEIQRSTCRTANFESLKKCA
jgi:hypothetical protein